MRGLGPQRLSEGGNLMDHLISRVRAHACGFRATGRTVTTTERPATTAGSAVEGWAEKAVSPRVAVSDRRHVMRPSKTVPSAVSFGTALLAPAGSLGLARVRSNSGSWGMTRTLRFLRYVAVAGCCSLIGFGSRGLAITLSDPGFEQPALYAGTFAKAPNGSSPWTFTGASQYASSGEGVSHPPNAWSHTLAPQGLQVAYIQGATSICQTASGFIPKERYTIAFQVTGRAGQPNQVQCGTCAGANPLQVQVNGATVEVFTPATVEAYLPHSAQFTATNDTSTICFVGVGISGKDVTTFIDAVEISEIADLSLSAPGNGAFSLPACDFSWAPAPASFNVSKYVLYVDGAVKKDNIPAAVTDYALTVLEQLSEGPHAWTVQACDASANCMQSPDTFTVNVDGTPPAPFSLTSPADNAWQSRYPAFNLQWAPTSDGASATPSGLDHYDVSIDGQVRVTVPAAQTSVSSNTSNIYYALTDGSHTWRVTAVDAVGNSTTAAGRTIRMDSTAPAFPVFTPVPANNSWGTNTAPTVQWQLATDTGSSVASQRVVLDSSSQFDPGASATSFTFPMSLADGLHYWYILATDQAGNSATTGTFTFGVDTTGPTGLRLSGASPGTADGAIVSSLTPTVCWILPTDAGSGLGGFRLYLNGTLTRDNISASSTCTTPPTGLSDGTYHWYIVAFDKVGNTSQSLETFTFYVDTQPPTAFTLLTPPDQSTTTQARPTFSWTASSDAGSGPDHYEVSIDNGAGGVCTTPCSVSVTQTSFVPTHDLGVGSHSWFVTAVDKANRRTQAGPDSFSVAATPTPTSTGTPTPTATFTPTPTPTDTPTATNTPTGQYRQRPSRQRRARRGVGTLCGSGRDGPQD